MAAFKKDLHAMEKLVADKKVDLYAHIPWEMGNDFARDAAAGRPQCVSLGHW